MSQIRQKFAKTSSETFSKPTENGSKKPSAPFSLRLSHDERAILESAAAGMPLGPFIKSKLFEHELKPRRTRGHAPVKDHVALAQALGLLGQLDLARSLSQIAEASKTGALPLSPEVEKEIVATCAAVMAVRNELMKALGYQSEENA